MKKVLFTLLIASMLLVIIGCPLNLKEDTIDSLVNSTDGELDLSKEENIFDFSGNVSKAVTITGGTSVFDMKNATLTIKADGVVLKNLINLNVIVDESVGDGDFTLDGCTLSSLTVNGGGENSIHISNCTVNDVVLSKKSVRVVISDNSKLTTVSINADVTLESTDTDSVFSAVTVKQDKISVNIAAIIEILDVGNSSVNLTSTENVTASIAKLKATKDTSIVISVEKAEIKEVVSDDTINVTIIDTVKEVSLPSSSNVAKVVYEVSEIVKPKTSYTVGDALDTTSFSAIVNKKVNDVVESTETLSSDDVTFTGFDGSKAGTGTITITYKNIVIATCEYEVIYSIAKERTPVKDITTEKEFITCITDSVNEYKAYMSSGAVTSSRAAVSTSEEATVQIKELIDEILKNQDFMSLITDGSITKDIKISKEIDLENIDIDEAIEIFNKLLEYIKSLNAVVTEDPIDTEETIDLEELGISTDSKSILDEEALRALVNTLVEKFKTVLKNSDFQIEKLYLKPDINLDVDATETDTFVSVALDEKCTFSLNVNKLIAGIKNIGSTTISDVYLPLSTISCGIESSLNGAITADKYAVLSDETALYTISDTELTDKYLISMTPTFSVDEETFEITTTYQYTYMNFDVLSDCISTYSGSGSFNLQGLICSATGLGGNIKVQMTSAISKESLPKYFDLLIKASKIEGVENLLPLYDDLYEITISSTNTAGKTTWTQTYSFSSLSKIFADLEFPKIEAGFLGISL